MREFGHEPVRGLPERLPEGERILWQGAPSFLGLLKGAFRLREVGLYFAALGLGKAVYAGMGGAPLGVAALELFGMAAPALLALCVLAGLAGLCARSTVYTITSRRIVFRFGMALEKAVNVPFTVISGAAVKAEANGSGDIALALAPQARISYLAFWPHVRPFRYGRAEPSLRGLLDVRSVGEILASALLAAQADMANAAAQSPDRPKPSPAQNPSSTAAPTRPATTVGAAHLA